MKISKTAFIISLIVFISSSCSSSQNTNTNPTANKTTLNIKAQITYSPNSAPQPVAARKFDLLDADLLDVKVPEPKTLNARSIEDYMSKLSYPQKLKSTIDLAKATQEMQKVMEKAATEKNVKLPPTQKLSKEEKESRTVAIILMLTKMRGETDTKAHFLKTIMTDSEGRADFGELKAGTYWIIGVTDTRDDYAFWNYKVTVSEGENNLILDQSNATYFK